MSHSEELAGTVQPQAQTGESGRTLAIGDVHGCHHALEALLDLVAVAAQDTVVFLGDLVDRGPGSRQVLDALLALREHCDLVLIQGNHEEMLLSAVSGQGLYQAWLDAGGAATLESYGGSAEHIPPEHIRLMMTAAPLFETDTDIFIHANLEPGVSLANQHSEYLRWKHLDGPPRPHSSGKRVICGHTPQTDGRPLVHEGWVCIDTFPHAGGWLTCLDAGTGQVYQASQRGATREFPLHRCQ